LAVYSPAIKFSPRSGMSVHRLRFNTPTAEFSEKWKNRTMSVIACGKGRRKEITHFYLVVKKKMSKFASENMN
jgi:hypothetical protein